MEIVRRILITGAGIGKSFLAECLLSKYQAMGVASGIVSLDSLDFTQELMAAAESSLPGGGFMIAVSNIPAESFQNVDFWQVIEVQKGSALKQADFLETATPGLGLCG